VISGDHERTALDFQKHYRLNIVHLMDTDRSFEAVHNRDGWPFLLLVDPNGNVVHQATNLVDREPRLLELLLRMKAAPEAAPIKVVDGIRYSTETLRRSGELEKPQVREQFSHLAAAPDGRVFLVFTSWRDGGGDVWLRTWDGKAWSKDRAVAATAADEYDGSVVVGPDRQVWFSWTGNAGSDRYNIFATSLDRLTAGQPPVQVTQADDDAMGARMACAPTGTLWLAYYKWQKNRAGISRDKEIFLRAISGGELSKEIQVSPTDVPWYEDHTDPALAILGDKALVCWSWDYHRPKGYPPEPESPTIFVRAIGAAPQLGQPFPASGTSIDTVPVLVAQGKAAWCTWDSLAGAGDRPSKTLFVRRVDASGCTGEPIAVATALEHICSPSFAVGLQGQAALVWCQKRRGGDWELRRSDVDEQGRWSEARTLIGQGRPRYCSAVFDARGTLWVSYTAATALGRQVKVERLEQSKL
jgi:hypothetical protein